MRRNQILCVIGTCVVCFGTLIGVLVAGWKPQLGLDLAGGTSVVYKPVRAATTVQLNQAISIIRNRVDALGVAEPNIFLQGTNIEVQLPGIKNPQNALKVIGKTAELFFRPVLCFAEPYQAPKTANGQKPPTTTTAPPPPCSQGSLKNVPSTNPVADTASATVLVPINGQGGQRVELGPAPLTGNGIKSALAQDNGGSWVVILNLTKDAAPKWDALAQANFHKYVAEDLDGVAFAPAEILPQAQTFQSFGGTVEISGGFSQSTAQSLAQLLNYGALPVQLNRLTVQSVSPTLGSASLHAGLWAGLGGLALVMLYMILYYRGLGIVVILGLATTAALLWAITATLGHTRGLALDLSGVTGIIVSVGITVDSYIVYFERLKDEVRAGKSIRQSVDRGFSRAYRTILAADLVSLIGALVLYALSVGAVKGFALFLGISTLLDIFSAYLFTRPLVILLGRSRMFTEARWIGVA